MNSLTLNARTAPRPPTLLLKSKRNIVVITSHAHMANQYIIDKSTKTLCQSSLQEINKLRKNSRYIKFISTLPLGALIPSREIGYLTITESQIKYDIVKKF